MTDSPDQMCKPDFSGKNSTNTDDSGKDKNNNNARSFDTQSIIGLVIFIMCVLYSSIRTSSSSQAAKLTGSDKILLKDTGEGGNNDAEGGQVWDNEEDEVAYSW